MHARSVRALAAAALVAALCGVLAGLASGAASHATATADAPSGATDITSIVPPPPVTASSWLVYDEAADEPIAGVGITQAKPIASLTKLMTALVVVQHAQQDALVTVPASINEIPADAAIMGLHVGEKWSVHDLLQGMLVDSAADAAIALATHVAGSEAKFVTMMNDTAADMDMTTTKFQTATGLDTAGPQSEASPLDLVILTKAALADSDIAAAVATEHLALHRPGTAATAPKLEFDNRNPLLGHYPGVDGVKTGFTDPAGYMLITHDVDPETNGRLIVVSGHSSSEATRISDGKALLDWGRMLRQRVTIADGGDEIATVPILHSSKRVHVFVCDDLVLTARVGQAVRTNVVLPRMLRGPISPGDEVGELRARVAGADADSVPLCSSTRVPKDTFVNRVRTAVDEYDTAWSAGVDEVRNTWRKLAG